MANKDVFNSKVVPTESWALDGAVITLSKGQDLLVSSATISYQRSSTIIRPINHNKKVIIVGDGSGQVQLSIIVGPADKLKDFLTQFANPCQISLNTMTIKGNVNVDDDLKGPDCPTNGTGTKFVCQNLLLNSINVSVQSAGQGGIAMINGTITLSLGSLEINE